MSKSYKFSDIVSVSGASPSELKNWVQRRVIRADIAETGGTGEHRTFGFLDCFEACVSRRLNQLPGGCPTVQITHALDLLRFQASLADSPWRQFLLPETRDVAAGFWLSRTYARTAAESSLWTVATAPDLAALMTATRDAVLLALPLHTLLTELELATQDHATADECDKVDALEVDKKVIELALAKLRATQEKKAAPRLRRVVAEGATK